ncbi:TPA: hypothetical protein N0F65_005656 [Lagenidium giganteum]|uniref:CCHC-type domain-containing protein n=1 Tax=Lagenidium giganteum TaxID=4803 RepID=A0AAV2ZBT5_9STRA|nr:TPA: hypothetical protein N0F65_005656 [Lagenidium giganteum]
MSLVHENFPHLSTAEWDALKRLAVAVGDTLVTSLLCERGPDEHRAAAIEFLGREVAQVRAERDALQTTCRSSAVPTAGRVNQRVTDDLARVAFAMSKLTGRARSWAFSRHMSDASCFRDLAALKSELRAAFEPSKSEFHLPDYVQKLRYLAASIVDEPIDMATQVATFMKGLRDGPFKNHLFREFPSTLEAAISLAQQEEFSCRQARAHSTRGAARHEAEPMDLSMIKQHAPFRRDASPPARREHFARDDTRRGKCHRCGRKGHYAAQCRRPAPMAVELRRRSGGRRSDAKNVMVQ